MRHIRSLQYHGQDDKLHGLKAERIHIRGEALPVIITCPETHL